MANEERLRVVVAHRGRVVEVAQVVREPTSFQVLFKAAPNSLHYSWRDGERPHATAERGDLADVGYDPKLVDVVRDRTGYRPKHWAAMWESPHWHDLDEVARTLSKYDYADRLGGLPDAKTQSHVLRVALGDDDAVETAHYLARPGSATDDFLAKVTADPYVEVWTCDRWEPWSIVTATVRPHATGRG